MTISLKHKKTLAIADDPAAVAAGQAVPTDWNNEHDLLMATARLLGRVTAGTGVVEELTSAQVMTFLGLVLGTAAGNVPVLDGSGKLATSILPALAISETFTVSSQSAMLALSAQQGDVAIRSDLNKSFILATNSPSTLADWKELLSPTDTVLSVAGLVGAITASALRTALALGNAYGFDKATAAQVRSATADKIVTADLVPSACAIVSLTDAATVALDWASGIVFDVALTANRTIGNPTNVQVGTYRTLIIKSSSSTARTPAYGSNFKGIPSDSVTNASVLIVTLFALSSTQIICASKKVDI